jgi:hypothetical protein
MTTGLTFEVLQEYLMLYLSPNIIRVIESRKTRWVGHGPRMGHRRDAYSVLVGKPERKRPLVRPMRTWKDDIKMDLQQIGYVCITRIGLAQDRNRWQVLVYALMNLRIL